MYVINRRNEREAIRYDKITDRNIELSKGLNVDPAYLSKLVIESLKTGMTTNEIDELSAETAFYMSTYEPDYDTLATRISVSNLHKQTSSSFTETVKMLYNNTNNDRPTNIISDSFMSFVEANSSLLDNAMDYSKDYKYNYFGFKTLCKIYLNKINGKVVERPQHMLMRVAVCIHLGNIDRILESYEEMSNGSFTHASPTLFNSGAKRAQLASCFLLKCEDDLEHIYETNKRSALISKYGGGIGIDITNVRCKGSVIHANNGKSDGIVPMCRVFNSTALYCNQCFHPDTVIYTGNGQKMIKDISIGDEVITIDGTYKPVVNIIINDVDKEILKIRSTYSFEEVKLTKEHQIYCLKGQTKNTNFNVILNRLNKGIIKPSYISAEELSTDDFIGFPLQQLPENDNFESLGNDFFRFYGAMLGDGHICSNRNEAGITLNPDSKIDTLLFIKKYLEKRNIHYWENKGITNCISIRWTNTNSGLTYTDLYDENKEKRINNKKFNALSRTHRINLIKGLLETDGSNGKEVYFSSTSYKLAHNLRYLLLSLGILSSGNIRDERGKSREIREGSFITHKKISYTLRISKHHVINEILDLKIKGEHCKYFVHNNIIWSRIKRISKEHYKGQVYDLSILNNNNYVVGSLGLVHNSGRRKGSIAMYLQPWHPDVFEFIALRYNNPPEELRARDLFTAMWIPDIFMRRVETDDMWSLIDPNCVRELCDTYGEEFEIIYEKAEKEGKYVKRIKARELWKEILRSQQETGLPYISYKDSINRKSNQMNIGIIRSSNLCNEIVEYTDTNSIATCNLASLSLPYFVKEGRYDFKGLGRVVKLVIKNLNNVIDKTYYPVVEAERNNLAYRPVGLGIQGLADVFAMFKLPWGSETATLLNRLISEVIYYYALESSHEFAIENNKIYSAFEGSPLSKGILQYDMWGVEPLTEKGVEIFGEILELDWDKLKEKCKKGVSNSLLIALMPTATSSQILGNNEAFEPYTSNIYTRSTISGDFIMVNKHLAKDLKELGLWDKDMVNRIIENNGSIQNIEEIPDNVKEIYKTVWEISQKIVIDYASDRGAFVDQTQSMNIFIDQPSYAKLSSMHMYGWKKGLKTGSYYIRSKPSRDAVKFTILKEEKKEGKKYMLNGKEMICTDEVCVACSS